jgi:hypothetical protein
MLKTLAFAIAMVAIAAISAPAEAMLAANGINLGNSITTGTALNGQIIGIELPAGTSEAE